jgi:hypothetical protein
MKEISLTKGQVALVDDADYERVSQFKWQARKPKGSKTMYAVGRVGKHGFMRLHRFILGIDDPRTQVDHRDLNGLNCQRSNLRVATDSQNHANVTKNSNNTSGYKGVGWYAQKGKWRARSREGSRFIHLGYFHSKEDAARAYDAHAKARFGEFARLNFPDAD